MYDCDYKILVVTRFLTQFLYDFLYMYLTRYKILTTNTCSIMQEGFPTRPLLEISFLEMIL